MWLILLGPPGAGKGTQARSLAQRLGLAHVASGDLFRQHQADDTSLGRLARSYMERGELVPDRVTIDMILQRVEKPDCSEGCILDGFPRTLDQAVALDDALRGLGQSIDIALYIYVGEEYLVRRLSGRLLCATCQSPYHRDAAPPAVECVCDVCGGNLYQRKDDSTEAVRNRLKVYQSQTAPLVEYYRHQNKLREIDGQRSIEDVTQAMDAVFAVQ